MLMLQQLLMTPLDNGIAGSRGLHSDVCLSPPPETSEAQQCNMRAHAPSLFTTWRLQMPSRHQRGTCGPSDAPMWAANITNSGTGTGCDHLPYRHTACVSPAKLCASVSTEQLLSMVVNGSTRYTASPKLHSRRDTPLVYNCRPHSMHYRHSNPSTTDACSTADASPVAGLLLPMQQPITPAACLAGQLWWAAVACSSLLEPHSCCRP